jgi:hypothetical protein
MPKLDDHTRRSGPLCHVVVMVPKPATVNVPVPGSILWELHTWPLPNGSSSGGVSWCHALHRGLPATRQFSADVMTCGVIAPVAPTGPAAGPTRAKVINAATASQPRRRKVVARRRAKLVCIDVSPRGRRKLPQISPYRRYLYPGDASRLVSDR